MRKGNLPKTGRFQPARSHLAYPTSSILLLSGNGRMNDNATSPQPSSLRPPQARARSEPELRALIVQALRASGIAVDEQVACSAGAADIVTVRRDVVIEVKFNLTRKQIQLACGQVLLYKEAINPNARAIVVGYATTETAGLISWAAAIGVEVICWRAEKEGLGAEGIGLRTNLLDSLSAL